MTAYHKLSIGQKQALQRGRMRESSVMCPQCDTLTTAADLLQHVELRCTGVRPEPHPGSRWVSWGEAIAMGAKGWTLTRWVQRGDVRFLGERQDRKYLMRDVAVRMAVRRNRRR